MAEDKLVAKINSWSLDTALVLTFLMGLAYLAIMIILVLNQPLDPIRLVLATFVLSIVIGFAMHRWKIQLKWQAILIAILTIMVSVLISQSIYDTSYDGQIYHLLAISSIKEHWNPLYHPEFPLSVWVQSYAKASWMLGAYLYVFASSIEAGKAINLIFAIASAFGAFAALTRVFPKTHVVFSAAAALLLAANPVVFAQLFSFYNDGLLASILLLYISMLVYYAASLSTKSLIVASAAMIILVNIKFTAVVYAGLATVFFLMYMAFKHRPHFLRVFLTTALAGFLGVTVFGFNPYITNIIQKGHPFYPLSGKEKIDIVTGNMPADFIGKSKWDKLILSLTGKPGSPVQPNASERRSPLWAANINEFRDLDQDSRVNGFGPYMFWILSGAFFLGLLLLCTDWRMAFAGGMFGLALLAIVWINPEVWWARYVPHFWWLPLVVVICAWNTRLWITKLPALLLMLLIAFNVLGSGAVLVKKQILHSQALENQLNHLKDKQLQTLQDGVSFIAVPIRFLEKDIEFTQASNDTVCKKPVFILFSSIQYCEL